MPPPVHLRENNSGISPGNFDDTDDIFNRRSLDNFFDNLRQRVLSELVLNQNYECQENDANQSKAFSNTTFAQSIDITRQADSVNDLTKTTRGPEFFSENTVQNVTYETNNAEKLSAKDKGGKKSLLEEKSVMQKRKYNEIEPSSECKVRSKGARRDYENALSVSLGRRPYANIFCKLRPGVIVEKEPSGEESPLCKSEPSVNVGDKSYEEIIYKKGQDLVVEEEPFKEKSFSKSDPGTTGGDKPYEEIVYKSGLDEQEVTVDKQSEKLRSLCKIEPDVNVGDKPSQDPDTECKSESMAGVTVSNKLSESQESFCKSDSNATDGDKPFENPDSLCTSESDITVKDEPSKGEDCPCKSEPDVAVGDAHSEFQESLCKSEPGVHVVDEQSEHSESLCKSKPYLSVGDEQFKDPGSLCKREADVTVGDEQYEDPESFCNKEPVVAVVDETSDDPESSCKIEVDEVVIDKQYEDPESSCKIEPVVAVEDEKSEDPESSCKIEIDVAEVDEQSEDVDSSCKIELDVAIMENQSEDPESCKIQLDVAEVDEQYEDSLCKSVGIKPSEHLNTLCKIESGLTVGHLPSEEPDVAVANEPFEQDKIVYTRDPDLTVKSGPSKEPDVSIEEEPPEVASFVVEVNPDWVGDEQSIAEEPVTKQNKFVQKKCLYQSVLSAGCKLTPIEAWCMPEHELDVTVGNKPSKDQANLCSYEPEITIVGKPIKKSLCMNEPDATRGNEPDMTVSEETDVAICEEPSEELNVTVRDETSEELHIAVSKESHYDLHKTEELDVAVDKEPSRETAGTVTEEQNVKDGTYMTVNEVPSEKPDTTVRDELSEGLIMTVNGDPSYEIHMNVDDVSSEDLDTTLRDATSEQLHMTVSEELSEVHDFTSVNELANESYLVPCLGARKSCVTTIRNEPFEGPYVTERDEASKTHVVVEYNTSKELDDIDDSALGVSVGERKSEELDVTVSDRISNEPELVLEKVPSEETDSNCDREPGVTVGDEPSKEPGSSFIDEPNTDLNLNVLTEEGESCEIPQNKAKGLRFKCDVCDYTSQRKSMLVRHIKTHTGERPYTCDICGHKFSRLDTIRNHMKTHTRRKLDEGKIRTKCNLGDRESGTIVRNELSQDPEVTERDKTPKESNVVVEYNTSKGPHNLDDILSNVTVSEEPSEAPGSSCNDEHVTIRAQGPRFKCDVCDYTSQQKSMLVRHIRCHTGERPYTCDICGDKFGRIDTMRMHIKRHARRKQEEGKIRTKCNLGDRESDTTVRNELSEDPKVTESYKTSKEPNGVVEYHTTKGPNHLDDIEPNVTLSEEPSEAPDVTIRDEVSKEIDLVADKSSKESENLVDSAIVVIVGERPSEGLEDCIVRHRTSKESELVLEKMPSTEPQRYRDREAGMTADDKPSKDPGSSCNDNNKAHTGVSKWDVFGYATVDKPGLTAQHKSCYEGIQYKCQVCEEMFNTKSGLAQHATLHAKGKRFKCDVCDYTSQRKSKLVRHIKSHTGEKPYTCDICGHKFGRLDYVRKHMKIHTRRKHDEGKIRTKCNLGDRESGTTVRNELSEDRKVTEIYKTSKEPNGVVEYHTSEGPNHLDDIEPNVTLSEEPSEAPDVTIRDEVSKEIDLVANKSSKESENLVDSATVVNVGERPSEGLEDLTVRHRTSKESELVLEKMPSTEPERYRDREAGVTADDKPSKEPGSSCNDGPNTDRNLDILNEDGEGCEKLNNKAHTGVSKWDVFGYATVDKPGSTAQHKSCYEGIQYKCQVCEEMFNTKSGLAQHATLHAQRPRFKCEVCDYTSQQKSMLVRHIMSHTGEKPYTCDICGHKFGRLDYVRKHMKIHTRRKHDERKIRTKCNLGDRESGTIVRNELSQDPEVTERDKTPKESNVVVEYNTSKGPHNLDDIVSNVTVSEEPSEAPGNSCNDEHVTIRAQGPRFKCDVCDYTSQQKSMLVRHIRCHTGERPYTCDICGDKFGRIDTMRMHIKRHARRKQEEGNIRTKCNLGDRESDTTVRNELSQDPEVTERDTISKEPNVVVEYNTSKVPDNLDDMVPTLTVSGGPSEAPAVTMRNETSKESYLVADNTSKESGNSVDSAADVIVGERRSEGLEDFTAKDTSKEPELVLGKMPTKEPERYRDREAGDTGDKQSKEPESSYNDEHVTIHAQGTRFKCYVCDYTSHQSSMIVRHMMSHKGEKPFTCDVCGRKFGRLDSIRNHMKTHTREKHDEGKIRSECYSSSDIPKKKHYAGFSEYHCSAQGMKSNCEEIFFKCDVCDYTNNHKAHLTMHMKEHTGEKPCTSNSANSKSLKTGGLRKYKCNVCDFASHREITLQMHIRSHTGEMPYSCDKCSKKFDSSDRLKSHMKLHTRRKHEGKISSPIEERLFWCKVCNGKYSHNCLVFDHKRIQVVEKPYKCEVCDLKFSKRSNLEVHTRVHTGGKNPYKCDVCGFALRTTCLLKRHMKIHMDVKRYKCHVCEFACSRSRHLVDHKTKALQV